MKKFTGKFPINQMYDDMRKVPVSELQASDLQGVAKHYGLDVETVQHWMKIIIELGG